MAFNRLVPTAATFKYVCRYDAAIARETFGEGTGSTVEEFAEWFCANTDVARELAVTPDKFQGYETLREAHAAAAGFTRAYQQDKYEQSGDESAYPLVEGETLFRWELRHMTTPERVNAMAELNEIPNEDIRAQYAFYRGLLATHLSGCEGWPEYTNGANGLVAAECLDSMPETWVLDMGAFLMRISEVRKSEKKA